MGSTDVVMEAVLTTAAAGAASGPQSKTQQQQELGSSIFVPDDAPVYDMPVAAINRPLLSEVNPAKVCGCDSLAPSKFHCMPGQQRGSDAPVLLLAALVISLT